jgi:hypothetical protein
MAAMAATRPSETPPDELVLASHAVSRAG